MHISEIIEGDSVKGRGRMPDFVYCLEFKAGIGMFQRLAKLELI